MYVDSYGAVAWSCYNSCSGVHVRQAIRILEELRKKLSPDVAVVISPSCVDVRVCVAIIV